MSKVAIAQLLEPRRLLANAVVIDLTAVFTPGAVIQVGSEALLRSRLQMSVDAMNRAMSNSRIGVSVRLVHADPITYTGANDLFVDRTRLTNGTNGLAPAHALRDTYGADLVTLIVENSAYSGGNASLMTSLVDPTNAATKAFSAITPDTLAPHNYTLAHELSHNLGAGHERGNTIDPAVGPFPYSYGSRFTGNDGVVYHDLMSYAPGIEVPYFANPAVSFHGTPTGSPAGSANEADLALTFAQTVPIVSAYRASVVADVAPTATLDTVRIKGGFAYITVRYEDDSGIDLSTIDSNDLTLFTPGLPQMTPVLDSIENLDVGGTFNRVTYRAYLRDIPMEAADIVVGVKGNAVRDVAGKAVPASASIARSTKWAAGYSYLLARDLGALDGNSLAVGDALGDLNSDDVFTYSIASPSTVSTKLAGLSQDANVFIARDANGDGTYQSSEIIDGSYRTGNTDESFNLNLAAGTYYVWVYGTVVTPYALQIKAYTDAVAPKATLDAIDITAPATQFTFNIAYDDDVEINAFTARDYSPIRMTNPFGGYYIAFAKAIDLDVNGPHRVVTYQFNAGFTLSAADNGVYTVSLEPNVPPVFNPPLDRYVGDGAGNVVPSGTPIGTFRVAIGQGDSTPPTVARVDAAEVHRGGSAVYDFDITYADNHALDGAALATSQATVTGPDGVPRIANAISVSSAPGVGSRRTVRYRLTTLPGNFWDFADFGTYSIAPVTGTVKDAAGNAAAAILAGSFKVSIPLPGDASNNGTVDFDDLVILAQNYGLTAKTFAQGNFDEDPAGNVDFNDLVILAQRYGTSRVELAAVQHVAEKQTKRRPTIDLLM